MILAFLLVAFAVGVLSVLGGGVGAATSLGWFGCSMMLAYEAIVFGALLWMVVSLCAGLNRAQWFQRYSWLLACVLLGTVSVIAFMIWFIAGSSIAKWVALAATAAAIVCLIRQICVVTNWCQRFGPWLRATGLPGFGRGILGLFHFVGWLLRTLWGPLLFCLRHVTWTYVQWAAFLATGAGLYYSMIVGPLWVSAWWWALAFAISILWLFAGVQQMVLGFLRGVWRAYAANWGRISGFWQGMLILFAGLCLCLCIYLLKMWHNDEIVTAFGKDFPIELWGVGAIFIGEIGTFLVLQAIASYGPRPPAPPQVNRRRAGAHP